MPLLISRASGAHGLRFRTASGDLSSFVLDSLRGLPETLQFAQGEKRRRELDERTRSLTREESRLKWTAGWGMALTNALILLFDLAMLLTAAVLFEQGKIGFDGVLVPTVALMSSFGPCGLADWAAPCSRLLRRATVCWTFCRTPPWWRMSPAAPPPSLRAPVLTGSALHTRNSPFCGTCRCRCRKTRSWAL